MTTCPACNNTASDPLAMRDWVWVRRGNDGTWLCSWGCVENHAANMAQKDLLSRYVPTEDEEKRMME